MLYSKPTAVYNIYFYIHFTEKPETLVHSPVQFEELINHIIHMVDRADCERGAVLCFEETNATQFITNLDALKDFEEFVGTLSTAEAISLILNGLSAENWQEKQLHETDEWKAFYRHFPANTRMTNEICPDVLKETAERMAMNLHHAGNKVLIIDIGNSFPDINYLSVIRGGGQSEPEMFNISKVSDFKSLEVWIYANTPDRQYNYNDNRHIENHPNYIAGKSPVLGGMGGKAHLAELLKSAIGDPKERQILANYDEANNGVYARYEYENVEHQNQYHGYHLVIPFTHEPDPIEIHKLPPRVVRLLEYRRMLEKKNTG